ncbi:hypothetical protein V492_00597 [Pseudogymnoascus sp. VKM F-4246]|nr:hypothetical protein V492_00597 [Pseudogymnoascus sp. VKM F-4246]
MANYGTGSDVSSDTLFRAEIPVEYLGLDRSVIAPVFAFAVRHRFQKPTVDLITRRTKTALDSAIVSALLAAALRMLPVDNTPQGVATRIVRQAEAKSAEDAFVAGFDRLAYAVYYVKKVSNSSRYSAGAFDMGAREFGRNIGASEKTAINTNTRTANHPDTSRTEFQVLSNWFAETSIGAIAASATCIALNAVLKKAKEKRMTPK